MSPNVRKIKYKSTDGTNNITAYVWEPESAQICGIVQIIHGMREHMGRYSDFAAFLNAKGYAVCGHDHLGHGESAKEAGKYGHFGEADGAKYLVRDSHRLTQIIKKEYPDLPLFLLGHSMGSFIGRIYVTHYAADIAGFICMGTGGENRLASVGRLLSESMIRAGHGEKEGTLLDKIAFGSYNKQFKEATSKNSWLTRDSDIVDTYDNDEHTRSLFTNIGFRDLLDLQMAATGKEWSNRVPVDLPILVVSGEADPVGDYGKGVTSVYERLKDSGVQNVSLKLYPEARHEILNELNKEEVYYDVYRWIEENK